MGIQGYDGRAGSSINDEMASRLGGAGPGYTSAREAVGMTTSSQRTISQCAEQTNHLNVALEQAIDMARQVADRIGAPFPTSAPQAVENDKMNGPIDYTHKQLTQAIEKTQDLTSFIAAIGGRV